MGIRFVCHKCGFALHVKDFQAGKRGKCPSCKGSFRIPDSDSSYSLPLDDASENSAVASVRESFQKVNGSSATPIVKKPSDSDAISLELLSGQDSIAVRTDVLTSPKVEVASPSKRSGVSTKMPRLLATEVNAKWFVRPPSGGQFGPADSELLMNWIDESRVTAESFLWREGMEQWKSARELLPELFESDKQTSSIVPPVPSPPSIYASSNEAVANKADLSLAGMPTFASGAVLKKRMQKRRRQLTMIIVLATLSLILLSILIFVLVFKGTTTVPEQPPTVSCSPYLYPAITAMVECGATAQTFVGGEHHHMIRKEI